jgi:hypothetical protein
VTEASATALSRTILEGNVEALGLAGLSLLAVRDATPRGRFVCLPDGSPAIDVDGKLLDRPTDPRMLDELVESLERTAQDVVLVFGIGAGHLTRALRDRSRASVIVYEPDPGILRTLLEAGPCDLGGVPIVCDLNDLKAAWQRYTRSRPGATTVQTPGYPEAYPAALQEVVTTVREMLNDEQCVENTRRVRFRQWVDNLVANLPTVAGSVPCNAIAGAFGGVPAFIVGAGPSLDTNIEHLREAKKRGLLIAVNSSASALAAAGITPDIVVCIESLDLSAKLGALPFIDDVVRVFSLSSHPANLATGSGPLLPVIEKLPAFENVGELLRGPGAEVGGSVSTVAFWVAKALGCSPLVLVGQDLAFTGYGTYARGTSYEGSVAVPSADGKTLEFTWNAAITKAHGTAAGPLANRADLVMVDAWGGNGQVPSGVMFASFRVWFEVAAAVFGVTNPELELVNATEGGARIQGFAEERLAELVQRLPVRATAPARDLARALRDTKSVSRTELLAWIERQARLTRQAGRAARRVGVCAAYAAGLLESEGAPDAVRRAFAVLGRAEAFLRRASKAQPLLEGLAYAEVQSRMEPAATQDLSDSRAAALESLRGEIALAATLTEKATYLERVLRAVPRTISPSNNVERKSRHVHHHADERLVSPGPAESE